MKWNGELKMDVDVSNTFNITGVPKIPGLPDGAQYWSLLVIVLLIIAYFLYIMLFNPADSAVIAQEVANRAPVWVGVEKG